MFVSPSAVLFLSSLFPPPTYLLCPHVRLVSLSATTLETCTIIWNSTGIALCSSLISVSSQFWKFVVFIDTMLSIA